MLIRMHSFEESTNKGDYFDVAGSFGGIVSDPVRTGLQSYNIVDTNTLVCPASQEHATFIIGFGFYRSSGQTPSFYLQSDSAGTTHIHINITADGALNVRRGFNGTILGSLVSGSIPAGAWIHIGIVATLHDSTGAVQIYLNGSSVLSLTGQDTKSGGTKTVFDSVGFTTNFFIDDLYWLNGDSSDGLNTFLGDKKVLTLMPNADGSTNDFTPSTGSDHYALLDEKPRSLTDYTYSSNDADVELVSVENVPIGTQNIAAVQVEIYANKSDAGTVMSFEPLAKVGSTTDIGSTIALSTGAQYIKFSNSTRIIYVENPDTNTQWTNVTLNAAEFGVRLQVG